MVPNFSVRVPLSAPLQGQLLGHAGAGMRRLLQPFLNQSFFCTSPHHSSSDKLFVGGLSWYVDEKSLNEAFSSFGDVTEVLSDDHMGGLMPLLVRIMYDKNTGRSRGFGFVHFSSEHDAKSAKDAMDGKALLGRPLRISFALDKVRGAPVVVPRISSFGDSSS